MPILNYTTKIDSYKTIMEIQRCLSSHGASKIVTDNDNSGNPIAITFCIEFKGQLQGFALPCNFAGVKKAMDKSPKVPRSLCTDEQAIRVGWRIIKDWVEAQMAIVESQLAEMAEVFIPYAVTKTGDTVYQYIKQDNQLLIGN
ncbi:MAG: hypothetical protein QM791_04240 [Ferruginibacter sp.]